MLVLVTIVAATSVTTMTTIAGLAGDLNGHMVEKTRIADDITALGQQIRFVDIFMLRANAEQQDQLAAQMIQDRVNAIHAKTASYRPYVDSDLERSLLRNLERSRSAYLDVQSRILSMPAAQRVADAEGLEGQLSAAFDQANRMARGLGHLAETEARSAREKAVSIAQEARILVIGISIAATVLGIAILVLLRARIYKPLLRITRALLSLSQGKLDVVLPSSGRGDEIDDMTAAFEVFRKNAGELASAHAKAEAAHEKAELMARHDALTGLPNRRVLTDEIVSAIARRTRHGGSACAVLLLDLDRFKPVNDIYGHSAGDKVLCRVADRLKQVVRAGEHAARLGGDEFAILIEYDPGNDAPLRLARRVIASIGEPIDIDGTVVAVGASIGIAVWPADGEDADLLLRAADLAMFKAKHEERGSVRFFEAELDVRLRARADLDRRIRSAIASGDIRPHYQPLVDLKRNEVLGFEILARWHDGDKLIPPNDFIPSAEEAGLIPDLTYSVLRQACRDARGWPGHLMLALNVTPSQIADLKFPRALLKLLAEEDFPASRLEIEITENALIGDISAARTVTEELRRSGIRLSLDDFGTGYSSLHHLRELKFDKIKIDQSFVRSMFSNQDSATIVETIIGLGRSLGIATIAEGIENDMHLSRLVAYGCEYGQGYLFGRPLDALKATEFLSDRKASAVAA